MSAIYDEMNLPYEIHVSKSWWSELFKNEYLVLVAKAKNKD
jgi:hypothetical protein